MNTPPKNAPRILMIGSDMAVQGGIGAVLTTYQTQGFLADKLYFISHREGPAIYRIGLFLRCLWQLLACLLTRPCVRLVHLHMSERGSFYRKALLATASRLLGRKVVFHLHGAEFIPFYQGSPGLLKRFIRHTLNTSDGIIVLSQSWQRDIREITRNSNVQVVYNPVALQPAPTPDSAINTRPVSPGSKVRCLFLGRFGHRKGTFDLLQAVARIQHPAFELALYGDGEQDAVRRLMDELNLHETVRVGGWIRGAEKARVLESSDILILPSYNEGLPVAILEAMANGLAVISTPVGGIPEAVKPGQNGILVPPGDIDAMARAIRSLSEDAETLHDYQQKSQRLCGELFGCERIFGQMEALYAEILTPENSVKPLQPVTTPQS